MALEPATRGKALVRVQDLSKRFGPDWALARASFTVLGGELALLTGPNGSGKTTLIRCLSTALSPDWGHAEIAGFDLARDRDQVRNRVATLTQPVGFYGELSALENLNLAAKLLCPSHQLPVGAILSRVGLKPTQGGPLSSYSAGMKQRFALARLSMIRRDVILLDEPETHLDRQGVDMLHEFIGEWKKLGAAVICATHAPERFHLHANTEVKLVAGRPERSTP